MKCILSLSLSLSAMFVRPGNFFGIEGSGHSKCRVEWPVSLSPHHSRMVERTLGFDDYVIITSLEIKAYLCFVG